MAPDSSHGIAAALRLAVEDPPRMRDPGLEIGGTIRARPEDFVVDEQPAYDADGRSGHLLVWMQKRSMTTEAALRELARALEIPRAQIGLAGLKDRNAVTGQRISLPEQAGPRLDGFRHPNIELSDPKPHSHKLRRGHLRGNRFRICVRELAVEPGEARTRAGAVFDQLATRGLYNVYGSQRFGHGASNLEPGLAALAGRRRRARKADMTLSAGQSALFNLYVLLRAQRGQCTTVLAGDILKKRDTGGLFDCEDVDVDQARMDAGELVVTGPMFGSKMRAPRSGSPADQLESEVLEIAKITRAQLARLGRQSPGTRRRILIWPEIFGIRAAEPTDALGSGLELEFALPAGSYATVLLRELT